MAYNTEDIRSDLASDNFYKPPTPTPAPAGGLVKRNTGFAGDIGTDLKRGVLGLPGMVTGLLDIPVKAITGESMVGKGWDEIGKLTGVQPAKWRDEAAAKYSEGRVASQKEVGDAWGDPNKNGWDVAGAIVRNPGLIAGTIAESAPAMVTGAGVGNLAMRGLARGAAAAEGATEAAVAARMAKLNPWIAGGSEGAVTAGQQMDQTQNIDGRGQALAAAAAGAITGGIGVGATKLAHKYGLETIEGAIVGKGGVVTPEALAGGTKASLIKRLTSGAAVEGAQEVLQSAQEQVWQNLATGNPLMDGVVRAGVEGGLAGMAMGAAINMKVRKDALLQVTDTNEQAGEKLDAAMQLDLFEGTPNALVQGPMPAPMVEDTRVEVDHNSPVQGTLDLSPTEAAVGQALKTEEGLQGLLARAQQQLKDIPPKQREGSVALENVQYLTQQLGRIRAQNKGRLKADTFGTSPITPDTSVFADAQPDLFGAVYPAQPQEETSAQSVEAPAPDTQGTLDMRTEDERDTALDKAWKDKTKSESARQFAAKKALPSLLAQFDALAKQAQVVGVDPKELAAITPMGEDPKDRALKPVGKAYLTAGHIKQLKALIADQEAHNTAQAGTEQFIADTKAFTGMLDAQGRVNRGERGTLTQPVPEAAPQTEPQPTGEQNVQTTTAVPEQVQVPEQGAGQTERQTEAGQERETATSVPAEEVAEEAPLIHSKDIKDNTERFAHPTERDKKGNPTRVLARKALAEAERFVHQCDSLLTCMRK